MRTAFLTTMLLAALSACQQGAAPKAEGNEAQPDNRTAAPARGEPEQKAQRPRDGAAAEGEGEESHGSELREGSANLDFIVVNRTGQTMTAVSISPAGEESWSDDILAQRELAENERGAVSYTRDVEQCLWDVRATFESGRNQSWPRRNLCDTIRVELR